MKGIILLMSAMVACWSPTAESHHLCKLKHRYDPATRRDRWAMPKNNICFCRMVIAPEKRGHAGCPLATQDESKLWYTDNPDPLTLMENWTPEKLNQLLDRVDFCTKNECDSNPCQNGATCRDDIGSFMCFCRAGYVGKTCQEAQCTAETAPGNGMRAPDMATIAVGSTLTLSCDSGYALVGTAAGATTGTCQDPGDGTSPTFNPVLSGATCAQCTAETAPGNGMRAPDMATIAVGSNLTLSCDLGYALVGTAAGATTGTCQDPSDGTSPTFNPVLSGATCECSVPLGMEDKSIPAGNIKASSVYSPVSGSHYAYYARLNGNKAWSVQTKGEWIQADIGYQTNVTGVVIQGDGGYGTVDHWVKTLKVSTFFSSTSDPETFITDAKGVEYKTFSANADINTAVTNYFDEPVTAQIVRIYPLTSTGSTSSMRFELLGCKKV